MYCQNIDVGNNSCVKMCISNFNLGLQGAVLPWTLSTKEGVPISIEMGLLEHQQRNVKVFFSPRLHFSEVTLNLALDPNTEVSFLSS